MTCRCFRYRFLEIGIIFLMLLLSGAYSARAEYTYPKMRHVLLLHSYHKDMRWVDDITGSFVSTLRQSFDNTEFHVEYMDTKRVTAAKHLENLLGEYRFKFSRNNFDLVAVADDAALRFVLQHYRELFPYKPPVVFCGINNFEAHMLDGRPEFTGVLESPDVKETLDIALKLHPGTKHVYIINDVSQSGVGLRRLIEREVAPYKNRVSFDFLGDQPLEELVKVVSSLPRDSIVLRSVFFIDSAGRPLPNEQISYAHLDRHISVPIYGLWDFFLGLGVVGGKMVSGKEQGEHAAAIAARILSGVSPAFIPVEKTSPNNHMYDYRQLVRFGIDRSLLPSGSVVIHEPVSFYKVNKTIIYGVALSTVALVSFTAVLLFNIRRRKKMELHLLKLSSEQQTILDTASSVIWHVVDHTIIWSNEATVRMLGYSADELQGTDYRQLLAHDTDGLYEQVSGIDVVSLKENEYQAEVRLRRKDGKLIWCSATARLIVKASPKDGYICILTDVTERHRVEQLLIEACDAADIANRAKNCFLNNMSHELRTPMNGILGMTSLLQLTDLSDEQRHYLEAVEASTTNLLSLITDILNFSKLNAELVAFESLPFSIKECINEVFEQHAARIRQKGLTAHVVFSPDVPQTVLGDQGRIHQMVHHLLSNAVKFSLQGTIEISLKVMSRSDSKVMLRLQLADTGVGIPAELNNSVFSPFNQADNSSTRRFGGAGLGLSIVSYLVNAMGGYIQLISNKEGGTTALLDIPLHLPENVPN